MFTKGQEKTLKEKAGKNVVIIIEMENTYIDIGISGPGRRKKD